jgi:hypothetical protein
VSGRPRPAYHAHQEFGPNKRGARIPVHTPRIGQHCRCFACRNARWWNDERRSARSDDLRQQYADGRRQRQHDVNQKRACHWRPEEDSLLQTLAGQHDCLTIGKLLEARFGYPRSDAAVKHRVKHLGIFLMDARPLSSSEVGRIFGITRETVRVRFVATGLLIGQVRRGGPHGMRTFERAELETLVREHPEAYDVEAIRDSRLRALADATARGRRLLPTPEVEKLTGVNYRQLAQWYADGLVPSARRVEAVRRGRFGTWLIEAVDLAAVRRLKAEHDERQRRRADACAAGHPRTPENLYIEPASGQRRCLPCRRSRRVA